MALLSRDQILEADDKKTMMLEVPEWGGQVKLAALSGHARDKFDESCLGRNGDTNWKNIRARLCAASIVDDEGKLLFSDKDIQKLGNKSVAALNRVFQAAQKLSAFDEEEVEELAKN